MDDTPAQKLMRKYRSDKANSKARVVDTKKARTFHEQAEANGKIAGTIAGSLVGFLIGLRGSLQKKRH